MSLKTLLITCLLSGQLLATERKARLNVLAKLPYFEAFKTLPNFKDLDLKCVDTTDKSITCDFTTMFFKNVNPAFCINIQKEAIQPCTAKNDNFITVCSNAQSQLVPCFCETSGIFNPCPAVTKLGVYSQYTPYSKFPDDIHWKNCFSNGKQVDCTTLTEPVRDTTAPFAVGDMYNSMGVKTMSQIRTLLHDGKAANSYPQNSYDQSIFTSMDFEGTFNPTTSIYREDRFWEQDPCLLYYSDGVCARCKLGLFNGKLVKLYRIVSEGSVRCGIKSEVDSLGKATCYITSSYYAKSVVGLPSQNQQKYEPFEYQNVTTGLSETICFDTNLQTQNQCKTPTTLVVPTDVNTPSYWHYHGTLSCKACNENINAMYITSDPKTGFYFAKCERKPSGYQTLEYLPCQEVGKVQLLQATIPTEQQIVCTESSKIIPNCMFASSATTCNMCQLNYHPTVLLNSTDSSKTSSVCLYKFCGISGKGQNCKNKCTLKNCLKCFEEFDTVTMKVTERCEICEVGYYRKASIISQGLTTAHVVYSCEGKFNLIFHDFYSPNRRDRTGRLREEHQPAV